MFESSCCFHLLIVSALDRGLKFPVPLHVIWITPWATWMLCCVDSGFCQNPLRNADVFVLVAMNPMGFRPWALFHLLWGAGVMSHFGAQVRLGPVGVPAQSCTSQFSALSFQDFSLTLQPVWALLLQPGRQRGFYHRFSSPHSTD